MNSAPAEQRTREMFFSSVSEQLNRLYDFVRHQLAYLQSTGDLLPGELTLEDVIDSVLLRAYHEFVKSPGSRDVGNWLTELAKAQIEREVKRSKAERKRSVHIEENIPEAPPAEQVKTLGDEILDFYIPDEDLKLEDVFPEADVSPPEDFVAAKEELLQCINAALARMPNEWRRALRLRHAERLTLAKLGEVLEKDEPEVERILEYARQHLRQSLIESGCTFIVKGDLHESTAGGKDRVHNG
jgi:RNA polymerase sigma factor (sigma-70 family)